MSFVQNFQILSFEVMNSGMLAGIAAIPILLYAFPSKPWYITAIACGFAPTVTASVLLGMFGFSYTTAHGAAVILEFLLDPVRITNILNMCVMAVIGASAVIVLDNIGLRLVDKVVAQAAQPTQPTQPMQPDVSDVESEGSDSSDTSETTESAEAVPEPTEATEAAPETTEATEAAPETTEATKAAPETTEATEAASETTEATEAAPETNWKASANFEALRNAPELPN